MMVRGERQSTTSAGVCPHCRKWIFIDLMKDVNKKKKGE